MGDWLNDFTHGVAYCRDGDMYKTYSNRTKDSDGYLTHEDLPVHIRAWFESEPKKKR
jgi:hypothetical protein